MRQREEVLNVRFAEVLCGIGLDAAPETIQRDKKLPDVLIQYQGMRIIIEGKLEDAQNAESEVTRQAQERIDLGIAQISAAMIYPKHLKTTPFEQLKKELAKVIYSFCVFSELGQSQWRQGDIGDIRQEISRVHESMCKEDALHKAAKNLSAYLDGVADLFQGQEAICEEIAVVLGIGKPSGQERKITKEKRIKTITKIAALTLANACIFQEQLAASGIKRVRSLRDTLRSKDFISKTIQHWDWICDNINYVPIFRVASNILAKVPAGVPADNAIKELAGQALAVCSNKAALRHDLMGRIYHYLLHEAKYLGTYYTSVSAATLLVKLALQPSRWEGVDFSNEESFKEFRAVDLTCGTGTLLMAICQTFVDNFVLTSTEKHKVINIKRLETLHNALMEHIIYGYDVLPSAIHLTASTIALLSPKVVFDRLHLYSIPLVWKAKNSLLGSLEFIDRERSRTQLNFLEQETMDTDIHEVTSKGMKAGVATVPQTDIFVMNPPFTRSVNSNLLFGTISDTHREKLQKVLKSRIDKANLKCNVTAGLGSIFVAVADKHLKESGRLAFVLPAAVASGIAWSETRELIAQKYHLEYVVISHDPKKWNFSENTDLSELLFVARKLKKGEINDDLYTTFINLWHNPDNIGDALAVARLIEKSVKYKTYTNIHVVNLSESNYKFGEALIIPMQDVKKVWWGSSFAQAELNEAGFALSKSFLKIPQQPKKPISLAPLQNFGDLGPDTRDIHDGCDVVQYQTNYPAIWNHESDKVTTMAINTTAWLSPRQNPAPGRKKIHPFNTLWNKSSNLIVAERLRLNTHRVVSGVLPHPALGNTWWEIKLHNDTPERVKALAMFLNSSIGVLILLFNRVSAEGAWINFKKPTMQELPVIDIDAINPNILKQLAEDYDANANKDLKAISEIANDPVREEIDKAISKALQLPDLGYLRKMLGREPVMNEKSILGTTPTRKPKKSLNMDLAFTL